MSAPIATTYVFAGVNQAGSVATYLYDPDNLKRTENVNGAVTTILWNGPDYLQGRA